MTPCGWGDMDQPWSCHGPGSWTPEALGFSVLILGDEFSSSLAHPRMFLGWAAIGQGLGQGRLKGALGGGGRMGLFLKRGSSLETRTRPLGWSLGVILFLSHPAASSSWGA